LIELQPDGSGLAPLVTSAGANAGLAVASPPTAALVQYGPVPTHLIWWLLLGTCVAAIVAVLFTPEPGQSRPGVLGSLRPQVSVPSAARGTFLLALPCLIAVWALGGLYLSLGPSLVGQQLHPQNLLWGGIVIFLLLGVGGIASVFVRTAAPATVMLAGCLFMLAGAIITVIAIVTSTPWAFLVGTAVADVGSGTGFLGAYRTVVAQATPDDRAGLAAAV
jgi:hypothetical protein